jgi:hypothetical protein
MKSEKTLTYVIHRKRVAKEASNAYILPARSCSNNGRGTNYDEAPYDYLVRTTNIVTVL